MRIYMCTCGCPSSAQQPSNQPSPATNQTKPPTPTTTTAQKYFGAAVGKGRQGAKTEIEKLKLTETNAADAVKEVAKM